MLSVVLHSLVLTHVHQNPTNVGTQQLTVQLPPGTKCAGGAKQNLCLASFTTTAGFGNCAVVSQGAGAPKARSPSPMPDQSTPLVNGAAKGVNHPANINAVNGTQASPAKKGKDNKKGKGDKKGQSGKAQNDNKGQNGKKGANLEAGKANNDKKKKDDKKGQGNKKGQNDKKGTNLEAGKAKDKKKKNNKNNGKGNQADKNQGGAKSSTAPAEGNNNKRSCKCRHSAS